MSGYWQAAMTSSTCFKKDSSINLSASSKMRYLTVSREMAKEGEGYDWMRRKERREIDHWRKEI